MNKRKKVAWAKHRVKRSKLKDKLRAAKAVPAGRTAAAATT